MEKHVQIAVGTLELAGSLHLPKVNRDQSVPLIIICHGFIGSRIGVDRLFVEAGRFFASKGYAVLRFDYAGCGESPGHYGDLRFEELIQQTVSVIDYGTKLHGIDPDRIVLIGHSLGGAVTVHTAALERRIHRLVLWSPVAYPFSDIVGIVGDDRYRQAKECGYTDYNGYLFSAPFFDSMEAYAPLLDIRKVSADILIVHGSNDDVIPAKYCVYYQKASQMRKTGEADKEIILGADHTYSNARHREKLFQYTADWLAASFGGDAQDVRVLTLP